MTRLFRFYTAACQQASRHVIPVFSQTTPPQWAGARLHLANEHVCCLTADRPHLLRLPTRLPSLFRPPPDNHAATSGELHSEGKCQSGAASPQSIPPETGAPHPSLLNISLLRLTPGKRGEMQPGMRVLPWGRRGRCCRATPCEGGVAVKVLQEAIGSPLNFGLFMMVRRRERSRAQPAAPAICWAIFFFSLKETNHH